MNKIADTIINGDNSEQTFQAVKLGFCKAMSDHGFSPKEAEGNLEGLVDLAKNYTMLMGAGGVLAGVGTAALRHKMMQTAQDADTPEIRATKAKVEAYKKLLANAHDQQQFEGSQLPDQGAV